MTYGSQNANGEREPMRWTGLATGCILEPALRPGGVLWFDTDWKGATIYGTGDERWGASSLGWIGRYVRKIVEDVFEDGVGEDGQARGRRMAEGRYLRRYEFVTSQNGILRCLKSLGEVSGEEWTAEKGELNDCEREAEKRMERGFLDGAMMLREPRVLFRGLGNLRATEETTGARTSRQTYGCCERCCGKEYEGWLWLLISSYNLHAEIFASLHSPAS